MDVSIWVRVGEVASRDNFSEYLLYNSLFILTLYGRWMQRPYLRPTPYSLPSQKDF